MAVVPSLANAAERLPTGQSQGVRIAWNDGGAMVVVFGKRATGLYRRIAGRKVSVACWRISADGRNGGDNPMRAPKRGRVLKTGDGVRDWDYCQVWRAARLVRRRNVTAHHPRALIVSIPLTQKGAVFVDEQVKAYGLSALLAFAHQEPSSDAPFYESGTLVNGMDGALRVPWFWPGHHPLVAMATPDETPPDGTLGYYSDGAEHATVVTLSAVGRRLFIENRSDDVLHTNVARYLFGNGRF